MLFQLRDYIAKHGVVSLQQISTTFDLDISAAKPMLSLLMQKGAIKPYVEPTGCVRTCGSGKCQSSRELYCVVS